MRTTRGDDNGENKTTKQAKRTKTTTRPPSPLPCRCLRAIFHLEGSLVLGHARRRLRESVPLRYFRALPREYRRHERRIRRRGERSTGGIGFRHGKDDDAYMLRLSLLSRRPTRKSSVAAKFLILYFPRKIGPENTHTHTTNTHAPKSIRTRRTMTEKWRRSSRASGPTSTSKPTSRAWCSTSSTAPLRGLRRWRRLQWTASSSESLREPRG